MGGLAFFAGLSIFIGLATIGFTALVGLALAYIALRVQDARRPEPDPRLGIKAAFHTIHTGGVILVLIGLSVFMIDMLEGSIAPKPANAGNPFAQPGKKDDSFNATQRTGVALVISGALFAVAFWGFLLGTNDASRRSVRRVFGGGRMALCLLVTMGTVTGLLAVLVQKEPQHEATESLLAILLVWFPASVVHMLLFAGNMRERRSKGRRDADEDEREWRPPGE